MSPTALPWRRPAGLTLAWLQIIKNDKQTRQQMREFEANVNRKYDMIKDRLGLLMEAQGIPTGANEQHPWA